MQIRKKLYFVSSKLIRTIDIRSGGLQRNEKDVFLYAERRNEKQEG